MDGFPQHQSQGQGHGAHHCQLAHAQAQGVHPGVPDGLLRNQQVCGIAQGRDDTDQVPGGRVQLTVQRQQGHAHGTHRQGGAQLPPGSLPEEQKAQQRGKNHLQGTDESGVGEGSAGNAVVIRHVRPCQGQAHDEAVPQGDAVHMDHVLPENQPQNHKGHDEAKGIEGHGRQVVQADIRQIIAGAPEKSGHHQQQVRAALFVHLGILLSKNLH